MESSKLAALADHSTVQVRVWDALNSTGLPPHAVRSALLLRGSAASAQQEGGGGGVFRLDLQSGMAHHACVD